jgi:plastocyanin
MRMKRTIALGLTIAAVFALQALRPRWAPAAEIPLQVQGAITLLPPGDAPPVKDLSKVAVWLVPLAGPAYVPTAQSTGYEIVQRDKKFSPELLVVPTGSMVTFPNRDPWFHNVFSLYRGKRFDLGLYQAGETKSVMFDKSGISYIFCNIHPQMAAVVLTVPSHYFGLTDHSGHVSIVGVPDGRYGMHVWYENADPAALAGLVRNVTVTNEDRSLPTVAIQVVPHDLRQHKNKYGRDYDTETLAPNY